MGDPTFALTVNFDQPYYDPFAQGSSPIPPPGILPVSIGGREYLLDTSFEPYRRDAFRHRTIPSQRASVNLNNIAGESTINTEGLWRRAQDDWSLGAGQLYLDRAASSPNRFYRSKGIDPWIQWQMTLLPGTKSVYTSAGRPYATSVGEYNYIREGKFVYFTQDWSTFIAVGGITGSPDITCLATNGWDVWIGTTDGIWRTTKGDTGSATQLVTSAVTIDTIAFVNDRLMCSVGPALYNITSTSPAALPTALFTQSAANWVWTCWGEGSSQIYVGGSALGADSAVYRTTVETDGSGNLATPVVALPMPAGENPTALYGYLNFIFLGTNLGIRMCQTLAAYDPTGNQGDLRAGPLIPNLLQPVTRPVYGIVGNGRFVYFGWSLYDSTSTGIGRLDLGTFIDTLAPAYASDRMVTRAGAGDVTLDWDNITDSPMLSVDWGVFVDDSANLVAQGTLDSGWITYNVPDDKIAMELDVTANPSSPTAYGANFGVDSAPTYSLGTQYPDDPVRPFFIQQARGEAYRVELLLDGVSEQGPTINRWTLKALPAVVSGIMISAVIVLFDTVTAAGVDLTFDVYNELAIFRQWYFDQTILEYVEGPYSVSVVIDSFDWLPHAQRDKFGGGYAGDIVVYLRTLQG